MQLERQGNAADLAGGRVGRLLRSRFPTPAQAPDRAMLALLEALSAIPYPPPRGRD